jgi:predicted RNase H-like HicB family nuclease/uncharacterized damage-inducible protein DinB
MMLMTKYLVFIETAGDPMTGKGPAAHVPALPGASARGQTVEEAKQKIQEAVAEYLALLRDIGEPVPRASEGIKFEFEEVDQTTFPTDYDTLHPNELEMLFRWMAISRQELVDLVKELPEETLDRKLDDNAPSVREILCRIAEADLWYTERLKRWPEAPLFRLAATRGVALERLRALNEADLNNFTIYDGKKWTPRKVIRRMLEHERERIQQIRGLLTAKQAG